MSQGGQTFVLGRGEVREIPVTSIASDAEALVIDASPGAPSWVSTEAGRLVLQPPIGTPSGVAVHVVDDRPRSWRPDHDRADQRHDHQRGPDGRR